MDQTQLQEKIAFYYQKLPEETKVLFAGMSWLETLKEIDVKYSLDDEQIKTLGTETTILLLSIITPDDYEQTIRTELKLEGEKTNKIIQEINEKIVKDVAPFIYKCYSNNIADCIDEAYEKNFDGRFAKLPKYIQDAIAVSNWREELYLIANKYSLAVDKQSTLEEITIQTLSGSIRADQYENEIKSKVNIPEDRIRLFITEINNEIFKKIKELTMVENYSPDNTQVDVPLPPYKNTQTEDDVPLPPAPKMEPVITKNNMALEIDNSQQSNMSEKDIYREHGIEIIPENNFSEPEKLNNEIEKAKLSIPKKESAPINIIENKLSKQTVSPTTITNYNLPKINPNIDQFPKAQGGTAVNIHDPYHETI